jgi:hypothetical protein
MGSDGKEETDIIDNVRAIRKYFADGRRVLIRCNIHGSLSADKYRTF